MTAAGRSLWALIRITERVALPLSRRLFAPDDVTGEKPHQKNNDPADYHGRKSLLCRGPFWLPCNGQLTQKLWWALFHPVDKLGNLWVGT